MKFTDGFWLTRAGVAATYAVEAHRIEATDSRVDVLLATKKVRHRGDTLNAATITLAIDSPLPDVVRVRAAHHLGGTAPQTYELSEAPGVVTTSITPTHTDLVAGALTARIHTGSLNLEFLAAGKAIASQRDRSLASMKTATGATHLSIQLSLGVGESVYGLGERFTAFVKNGQSVDVWNEDGGSASEQAYKNVPFYLNSAGYGVFVNHTDRVSFEVGSEAVERVQFSAETEQLEYLVIYGPTPKEILTKYTALTGRAPVVPHWSFGLWLSTSFVTNYDEATVTSFLDEMRERSIPLSVFHFDCFWMREFQWCDFEWDPRTFPDPAGMLSRIKKDGLHVSVWINSYIGQASPLFAEAAALGYLLRRADGSVWQWDLWQAGNAVVDFSNPDACEWFKSKLRPLIEMGVDAFKTDFGERIPTDVVFANGVPAEQMHNLYTYLYNRTVFEVLSEYSEKDALVWARSATVGSQSLPVHWSGDSTATFESMAETLRGGLSLALAGFGYWSHDIGGFEGDPDPTVFKRWVAFGLLSSHSRLHGNESVRVPWVYDEEAVDVLRTFTRLKARLMPYLYAAAHESQQSGWPMLRPMMLEFPTDRTCAPLDLQYMLGENLLVAPVFSHEGTVEFYLPEGTWTSLITGEKIAGPRWVSQAHGFESIPLFARGGSIVVTGSTDDGVDYDYQADVAVTVYELAEGSTATATVHGHDGSEPIVFTATRTAGELVVSSTGTAAYTVVDSK